MNAVELKEVLAGGTLADHLGPAPALRAADGTILTGDAVRGYLTERPDLLAGFVPVAGDSRLAVCGTNADGLAVKVTLFDGVPDRIVFKRPVPGIVRIRLEVAYDGTDFAGFQRQADRRSVQAELEAAVARINDRPTTVNGASRTDAGVHARGQVAHFDTPRELSPARWREILNYALPDDLRIVAAQTAHPLFHARLDAWEKEYRYVLDRGEYDPLGRHAAWYPGPFDLDVLRREAAAIVGTHDFTSFCRGEKESKVRTVRSVEVCERDDRITLVFTGDGFLHGMIRLLVAALVRMAKGIEPADMATLLAARDRHRTQTLAPAGGLTLMRVDY